MLLVAKLIEQPLGDPVLFAGRQYRKFRDGSAQCSARPCCGPCEAGGASRAD
jgi:hypothetical protein